MATVHVMEVDVWSPRSALASRRVNSGAGGAQRETAHTTESQGASAGTIITLYGPLLWSQEKWAGWHCRWTSATVAQIDGLRGTTNLGERRGRQLEVLCGDLERGGGEHGEGNERGVHDEYDVSESGCVVRRGGGGAVRDQTTTRAEKKRCAALHDGRAVLAGAHVTTTVPIKVPIAISFRTLRPSRSPSPAALAQLIPLSGHVHAQSTRVNKYAQVPAATGAPCP
jgi:hypothetical protein